MSISTVIPTTVAIDLTLSDKAATKLKALMAKQENDQLKLRVVISGGGCSGFQYAFEFDENVADTDVSVENNGATLVIDAMSYQYLVGAEVDYVDDLQGSQFVIKNPNAASTCGCGASFSV
ncbi:MAG TPA: iron-sulfur cluster insertion protein ErpA [Chromatiaceae bacterium]|jgi:iron-sulfur cluster insertion protein|nr:iron-sulfur cluster insertion protein ErpA [Chromatiaceae bacterium]HIN81753.1 iron-sulfur cluster insertion protein ErpA [Chromatiales bacterium]HIA07869.1 iron-sulfur cluster insertion protein ErpA [Chromatiaceae bacterium]HIB84438.1 iron-sulfur cluster insertion protein ErpA [Chromatiaceae bacterium]HIO14964.1 iron-sulfur cluster insertion protein ErpA [Chromatiales bacterium]